MNENHIPLLSPFKSALKEGYVTTADQIKGLKEYIDDEIGKLDVFTKDMVVSGGQVRQLTDDEVIQDTRPQGLYIVLTIANSTNDKLYIPVNQLVDNYNKGSYITIKDRTIAVDIDSLEDYFDTKYDAINPASTVRKVLNTKQDKTAIVTATDVVSVDKRSVIDVTGHAQIRLKPYEEDGYAHSYEIVLNVGDTAYSVAFPEFVKWVKNLEIVPNARYYIIIEDNTAMWTAVTK